MKWIYYETSFDRNAAGCFTLQYIEIAEGKEKTFHTAARIIEFLITLSVRI